MAISTEPPSQAAPVVAGPYFGWPPTVRWPRWFHSTSPMEVFHRPNFCRQLMAVSTEQRTKAVSVIGERFFN